MISVCDICRYASIIGRYRDGTACKPNPRVSLDWWHFTVDLWEKKKAKKLESKDEADDEDDEERDEDYASEAMNSIGAAYADGININLIDYHRSDYSQHVLFA
jgi:hypothetical protein